MNFEKTKQNPDWRNTLYQFFDKGVGKYSLRRQEITLYMVLLSKVSRDGLIKIGNAELMRKSAIGDKSTFKKARDRLVEIGMIEIADKGKPNREFTNYRVKLLGKPKNLKRKHTR
ncbi:MAG: hypothetical protein FWD31_07275 [Planctomycetaceae bacterium]|nr:hypothetical protein [Planctomycetaceae bacterium]